VDMQAVLALTASQCPECGHMGAAVTLSEDEPPVETTVRSDSGLRDSANRQTG
jgi:hypothetical protein